MRHGVINSLELPAKPHEPIPDVLDVERFLRASGFRIRRVVSRSKAWRRSVQTTRELTGFLAAHWSKIGHLADALNTAAGDAQAKYQKGAPQKEPVRVRIDRKLAMANPHLMQALAEHEVVAWSEERPTQLDILDFDRARYLGGLWLEEYVFLQLSDLGLYDLAVGVHGHWQGGGVKGSDNEFDVVATHGNRLLFIECKAGVFRTDQKIQDMFGKIDAIGNRVAGRFGSVMMVSPRALKPAAIARAETGRIFPLHGEAVTRVRDVVARWMDQGRLTLP